MSQLAKGSNYFFVPLKGAGFFFAQRQIFLMVEVSVRTMGGWLGVGKLCTIFFGIYDFSYKNNYYCITYLNIDKLSKKTVSFPEKL
jgi:hypothetical protein